MALDPRLMRTDYSQLGQVGRSIGQGIQGYRMNQLNDLAGKALMRDPQAIEELQMRNPMMANQVMQQLSQQEAAQAQAENERLAAIATEAKDAFSQFGNAQTFDEFNTAMTAATNSGLYPNLARQAQQEGGFDEDDFVAAKMLAKGKFDETQFDQSAKLRSEFSKETKEFADVNNSAQRIIDSANNPSAAGDLALIFNYMKMLDPGSTVRESEFENAASARAELGRLEESGTPVPNAVKQAIQKIFDGTTLLPDQRADFVNRAKALYQGQADLYKSRVGEFSKLAERMGVNPEYVIVNRDLVQFPDMEQPEQPEAPNKPMTAQSRGEQLEAQGLSDDEIIATLKAEGLIK